jgi:hypothetical protein
MLMTAWLKVLADHWPRRAMPAGAARREREFGHYRAGHFRALAEGPRCGHKRGFWAKISALWVPRDVQRSSKRHHAGPWPACVPFSRGLSAFRERQLPAAENVQNAVTILDHIAAFRLLSERRHDDAVEACRAPSRRRTRDEREDNGAPFAELPPAFRTLSSMLKTPGGDRRWSRFWLSSSSTTSRPCSPSAPRNADESRRCTAQAGVRCDRSGPLRQGDVGYDPARGGGHKAWRGSVPLGRCLQPFRRLSQLFRPAQPECWADGFAPNSLERSRLAPLT